jgi:hypothetical protein
MMPNPELFDPAAQKLAVTVGADFAEHADLESQHARPSEMVEHQAADRRTFHRAVVVMGVERDFLLGVNEPRRAVEQVHHHAAAADDVEFCLSHP